MQISALTDIVEGKLLNSPSISFITQIHTNVNKVNEGDAFFASNKEDIALAVKKGAFAIITDFLPQIEDDEIAWITVDNNFKAITNTLRYHLLQYKISFVHIDRPFFTLLEVLKNKEMHQEVILISDNIYNEFEKLYAIDGDRIIFGCKEELLMDISANITRLKQKEHNIKNLTNHSLFETSFSYKDKFFDKIKLPYLYINRLITVLELFKYKLDLRKLANFNIFEPIFINKGSQIVPFGQTNKFIIANNDPSLYDDQIKYLEEHYSYGDIKILDAFFLKEEEIYEYISNNEFNALYIKGKSSEDIRANLTSNDRIDKLF